MTHHHHVSFPLSDGVITYLVSVATVNKIEARRVIAVDHIELPEFVMNEIHGNLEALGIGEFGYAVLCQHRRLEDFRQTIHIDYWNEYECAADAGIMIPLDNYQNGLIAWWGGDYDTQMKYGDRGVPAIAVKWNSSPVIQEIALFNKPILARNSIPYEIINMSPDYSTMLMIRIVGNESFDTLMGKLSSNQ